MVPIYCAFKTIATFKVPSAKKNTNFSLRYIWLGLSVLLSVSGTHSSTMLLILCFSKYNYFFSFGLAITGVYLLMYIRVYTV